MSTPGDRALELDVPATRTLPVVLRRLAERGDAVRLVVATAGAALAGADANAYVNVVVQGVTVKVPRLKGAALPAAGGPAYLLSSRDFLLYIGTVSTT